MCKESAGAFGLSGLLGLVQELRYSQAKVTVCRTAMQESVIDHSTQCSERGSGVQPLNEH